MTALTRRKAIVDRSYQLSALLGLAEQSARDLNSLEGPELAQAAGWIATGLELAHEIADEVHTYVEASEEGRGR